VSLRILGGTARGRAFAVPDSARPSGVRLRKSLFDLLAVHYPEGSFLDLHGGSGAVALEAASRGYAVTVVERDPAALRTLTANSKALGLYAKIIAGDSGSMLGTHGRDKLPPHQLVFSDPPYDQNIPAFTARVLASELVLPGGMLMAQHIVQIHLPEAEGYQLERRVYGSNALSLYTRLEVGHEQPAATLDS
jgi:16S rRNA (guanine966-N2)-methyltransferase